MHIYIYILNIQTFILHRLYSQFRASEGKATVAHFHDIVGQVIKYINICIKHKTLRICAYELKSQQSVGKHVNF